MNKQAKQTIPAKPVDSNPATWLVWVNQHYPYDPKWATWLQTRLPKDRPEFGTAESLNDLRGIADREQSALCALHWWNTFENQDRIKAAHVAARRDEQETERRRLILLAKQALEGKLGESATARDDARSTAQTFLRQAPEQCSDDDLGDWMKMHQYAKRLAAGRKVDRPKLAADVRKEAAKRRELEDINASIDAAPAGRPRQHQEALGQW